MAVFEVPLSPDPQTFTIQLAGITYRLTVWWNDADDAGWTMNVADANDLPLVNGIPLVTGSDLLAQFEYVGFGGELRVQTDNDPQAVPTFTNLGILSHLYFITTP